MFMRSHKEERIRNTHAVWLVSGASDWLGGGADEPMGVTELSRCVTRRVRTVSCQHHGHRQELHDKSTMCFTCHIALGVDSAPWRGGLERPNLTQKGHRDDDTPSSFRLVRTVKRTSFEDRWRDHVNKRPVLGWRIGSGAPSVHVLIRSKDRSQSRAQRLERAPVDVLAPGPDHEPLANRLYLKHRDFSGARDVGSLALVAGRLSVVVVHRDTLRSVEIVSRCVEEDRSRQSPPSSCGPPRG